MKKNNKKVLEGTLLGAALGVAAGLLLAPESGKKLRKDISDKSAEFYKYMSPRLRKLKKVGEKEYAEFVEKAAVAFVKGKKISDKEVPKLVAKAKAHYKNIADSLSS